MKYGFDFKSVILTTGRNVITTKRTLPIDKSRHLKLNAIHTDTHTKDSELQFKCKMTFVSFRFRSNDLWGLNMVNTLVKLIYSLCSHRKSHWMALAHDTLNKMIWFYSKYSSSTSSTVLSGFLVRQIMFSIPIERVIRTHAYSLRSLNTFNKASVRNQFNYFQARELRSNYSSFRKQIVRDEPWESGAQIRWALEMMSNNWYATQSEYLVVHNLV